MTNIAMLYLMGLVVLLLSPAVFAQGYGEYGRAGASSKPRRRSWRSVGESDVRRLPARLVVEYAY